MYGPQQGIHFLMSYATLKGLYLKNYNSKELQTWSADRR